MVETETKVQRYDSYKESGVSWLEEVPKHWEVKRFKHIFKEKKITHNVDLNCGSISFGKVVYKDDEKIPVSTKKSYQVLNRGEFLINPLNLNYDLISLRIALSDKDVVVSSGYIIVKNIAELSKSYYKWLLHIFDIAFMKTLGSGVRQTLSFTHVANSELVFPPLQEQTAIAQFLDDKTTKIDDAITIKEKQINLLKERKQILIHKAVTRGLNPNLKLKDSGVEWIGEIPEHWVVSKFKNYIKLRHGHQFLDHDFMKEGIEVVKITQLHKNGYLDLTKATKVAHKQLHKYSNILIKENDVLMCLTGGTIGKIIKVGKVNRPLLQNYRVGHFSSINMGLIINEYIYHLMSSEMLQQQIFLDLGETGQPNIGMEDMKNMIICVPPTQEQKEISAYIETASQKTETAISLKQQEIAKLKEYKSSLINSVVTGKVKVC